MNKKRAIPIAVALFMLAACVLWTSAASKPRIEVQGNTNIMNLVAQSGTASPEDLAEIRRVALHDARQLHFHNLYQSKGASLRYIVKSYFNPGVCFINYKSDRIVHVSFSPSTNWQNNWWFEFEAKGTNGWHQFFFIYD